jgi:hypothetical protein
VLHIITLLTTTDNAWQPNIIMITVGSSPAIAPSLQHFQDVRHSASFEHLQRGVKGNGMVEVQRGGLEQIGEMSFDGAMNIEAILCGYKLSIDQLLNGQLAQIRVP